MPPPNTIPRNHAPIHLWHPTIHTTPIATKTQLHTLIHTEYPHLKTHPNYPKLLTDAERHLAIIIHFKHQTHLKHGDIAHLARKLGVKRTIIYRHVRQALKPRLYWFIENAISKTQAHHQLAQINGTNTHIQSLTDLHDRLNTYYPAQYLDHAKGQPDRLTQCEKYFQVLTLLAEGGHSYTDLAATTNKTVTNIKEWCTNQARPGLLNLARRIPPTPPPPGNQWLTLTMQGRFHPTTFIHVPTTITTWTQLPPVLKQLQPLTNPTMTQWQKQFGPISQEDAFAYLLGNLVSDAGKITPYYTSTRIELNLSKNYDWSKNLGDAVCYYLGHLGIFAEYKRDKRKHRWRSQNTPLLTWIKHICLGLTPQQLTTYTPINAPWILIAPRQIRIRILQGLNDGDGHVLTGYEQLGNASEINSKFLKELLKTFKIKSIINVRRVIIENRESILRAIELPFFLHAQGRQEKAIKLGKMARNKRHHLRSVISKQVADDIIKLHQEGKSSGAIVEIIYDKHNICYSSGRVRKIIRDHQDMKIEFLSEYLEEIRGSTD